MNCAAEFLVGVRRPTVEPQSWWVRYTSIPPRAQMAADGASFSLPHLPAKFSSLNAERPLSLGGANWPSCPTPVVAVDEPERLRWVDIVEKVGILPSVTYFVK